MATSVTCSPAILADGQTYDGQTFRTNLVAASFFCTGSAQVRGGVMPSGGQMTVSAGGGMSVNIGTGSCVCPSSAGSTEGGYLFGLFTAANLSVGTSDAVNPRIDLLTAFVSDPGTSSGFAAVEILTGTPAAGASLANLTGAPSVPSNGIALGYLLVPANSTSVTSGNISNVQTKTVAQGGILPVNLANAPTGYNGAYIHDTTSGSLKQNPPSGPAQAKVLPWAAQVARATSNQIAIPPTSGSTILSVSVTVDGNTDLNILAHWPGIYSAARLGLAYRILLQIQIDGTEVAATFAYNSADDASTRGGGDMTHYTVSGVDRPATGTHTVSLVAQTLDLGVGAFVAGATSQPILLRVAPVTL